MLKYYLDITLLTGAEADLGFLWQKVYQQMHLALVENKVAENTSEIAISIPGYGNKEFPLGNKLRLFAKTKEALIKLDINKWLNRLTDYVDIKKIQPVPDNVTTFAYFKRQQVKSSKERLARRKAKREGIDYELALEQLKGYEEKRVKTPFINITSQSSGKQFRLFIEKCPADKVQVGQFNSYGLSKTATVPWF